jgi:hypothetical protein
MTGGTCALGRGESILPVDNCDYTGIAGGEAGIARGNMVGPGVLYGIAGGRLGRRILI